jgi:hypothetical protein
MKATRISLNKTKVEEENLNLVLNESVYMPMNGSSVQFGRTYFER